MDTPALIDGRFEVAGSLGEGPHGRVYRVVDHSAAELASGASSGAAAGAPGAARAFATLKILRAEAVEYGELDERLAELLPRLQGLKHAGINPLLAAGRTPLGLLYLASAYEPGESLARLLARRGPLPSARVAEIGRQMLAALDAGHRAGVAHGDLHPSNVLLKDRVPCTDADPFGTGVLLLDYGTLALFGAAPPAESAAYRAPEGEGARSAAAADLYAAGAILLELATGEARAAGSRAARRDGPLAAVFERAVSRDPAARFADARSFLEALAAASAPRPAVAAAPAPAAEVEAEAEIERLRKRAELAEAALGGAGVALAVREAELAALGGRVAAVERASAVRNAPEGAPSSATEAPAAEAATDQNSRTARAPSRSTPAPLAPTPTAPPRARPARALVAALAGVALGFVALWWNASRKADVHAEEVDAAGIQLAERAQRAESALDEAARAAGAPAAELAAAKAELESLKQSALALQRAVEDADALRAELARLERELESARERERAASSALERASDPELRALDALDGVLEQLAAGESGAARARFDALAASDGAREGLAGLERLTRAALALDGVRDGAGAAELESALAARDALEAAAAPDGVPALAASAWVRREGDERSPAIEARLDELERRFAQARSAVSEHAEERWEVILNDVAGAGARDVLAIADWFDDGRLAHFLEELAASVRDAVERDGALDCERLLALEQLPAFGAALSARAELHELACTRELVLFDYARAWHAGSAEDGPPKGPVWFQGPDGSVLDLGSDAAARQRSWRADLALRAELASGSGAWPGADGSRFLFLTTAELEGGPAVTWQLDEVIAVEPGAERCTWRVRRSFYREDGAILSSHLVSLERRGKRFFESDGAGGALLDLSSDAAELSEAPPAAVLDVVPPPGIIGQGELESFRSAFARGTGPAVVYRTGDTTGWYSPLWGCLAVEDSGRFRRELVFAAPVLERR